MEKNKPKEQCSSSSSSLVNEISCHPLFSILATSSLLILLYSPHLLPLLCSPVLISTSLLLTTLLRLGPPADPLASHPKKVPGSEVEDQDPMELVVVEPEEDGMYYVEYEHKANLCGSLVEWGRRGGPLEVIYEEFEGEEDDNEDENEISHVEEEEEEEEAYKGFMGFYDSVESSCSSSSSLEEEKMMFLWEEEEEDNLIEIDIRTCR